MGNTSASESPVLETEEMDEEEEEDISHIISSKTCEIQNSQCYTDMATSYITY